MHGGILSSVMSSAPVNAYGSLIEDENPEDEMPQRDDLEESGEGTSERTVLCIRKYKGQIKQLNQDGGTFILI